MIQEAVATGDPELVQLVLQRRDYQRLSSRAGGVPELLLKLKEVMFSVSFMKHCFVFVNF